MTVAPEMIGAIPEDSERAREVDEMSARLAEIAMRERSARLGRELGGLVAVSGMLCMIWRMFGADAVLLAFFGQWFAQYLAIKIRKG